MKLRSILFLIFIVLCALGVGAQEKPDALQAYRIGRDLDVRGRSDEAYNQYEEAVQICKNEINQNESNMDSYTVLTWALFRQNKFRDVIDWGQRALKINPNEYRVIETMGEAYFYLNDYASSLKSMQKYIDSAPQGDRVSVAYFFIGEIYRLEQKFHHADIAYTTAVRLESNIALWWYRLGSVREALADYAPAIEAYERALRLNSTYKEASEGLDRSRQLAG